MMVTTWVYFCCIMTKTIMGRRFIIQSYFSSEYGFYGAFFSVYEQGIDCNVFKLKLQLGISTRSVDPFSQSAIYSISHMRSMHSSLRGFTYVYEAALTI